MKKFCSVVLFCAFVISASLDTRAQVSTTGPAGLARQMPQVYSPYMANRSRIKYQQRHKKKVKPKQKQKRVSSHTTHTH